MRPPRPVPLLPRIDRDVIAPRAGKAIRQRVPARQPEDPESRSLGIRQNRHRPTRILAAHPALGRKNVRLPSQVDAHGTDPVTHEHTIDRRHHHFVARLIPREVRRQHEQRALPLGHIHRRAHERAIRGIDAPADLQRTQRFRCAEDQHLLADVTRPGPQQLDARKLLVELHLDLAARRHTVRTESYELVASLSRDRHGLREPPARVEWNALSIHRQFRIRCGHAPSNRGVPIQRREHRTLQQQLGRIGRGLGGGLRLLRLRIRFVVLRREINRKRSRLVRTDRACRPGQEEDGVRRVDRLAVALARRHSRVVPAPMARAVLLSEQTPRTAPVPVVDAVLRAQFGGRRQHERAFDAVIDVHVRGAIV